MKLYKVKKGMIIHNRGKFYMNQSLDWDSLFREDHISEKLMEVTQSAEAISNAPEIIENELEPPVGKQEIWASGVTYINSKLGREEESKKTGGGQFYAQVYVAERPELFFKGLAHRSVASGGLVRIRKDSIWDVPEPELTLAVNSMGRIFGYTIGNDMSSRSIEGENPLYLPQAKIYDGSASLGPCIYISEEPIAKDTVIQMEILRDGMIIFEGSVGIDQMKRKPEELASWLYRECSFPDGCFLMTGTGIVPGSDFTLQQGDEIHITIQPIGTLINTVSQHD